MDEQGLLGEPVPTETVPIETVPTELVPTELVPTQTVPTEPILAVRADGAATDFGRRAAS